MRLRLKVLSYQRLAPGQQVEKILERKSGSIGRSPTCDWRLPDPTRVVSGHHADIEFEMDGFSIVDRSTNGLFVNHSEQAIGTGNRVKLNDGDVLTLGEYEVQVSIESMEGAFAEPIPAPIQQGDDLLSENIPPLDSLLSSAPAPAMSGDADDAIARLTDTGASSRPIPSDPIADLGLSSDHFEAPKINESPATADNKDWDANWLDQVSSEPAATEERAVPLEQKPTVDPDDSIGMGLIPDDWEQEIMQTQRPDVPEPLDVLLPDSEVQASLNTAHESNDDDALARLTADSETPIIPDTEMAFDLPKAMPQAQPEMQKPSEPVENDAPRENINVSDAVSAFFAGFGYKPEKMSAEEQINFMQTAGASLRESLEGMLEALKSRSVIKGEIQANQTMIGATENNPLKFSVNLEDAVYNMFEKRVHGFLSPKEAIREAMHDIKTHQVGLMAGTDAVLRAMLKHLSPENIKPEGKSNSLLDKVGTKDGKSWKEFVARHQALVQQLDENPQSLYAKEFAAAYEAQMEELKREAIRHLYQEPIF